MGLIGTIGAIVIGVIAFIVIAGIVIFLVTFFAPVLIALIILAILIGVGYWIYGKIKTKKQAIAEDAIYDILHKVIQHYNHNAPRHHPMNDENCCTREIKDILLDYKILAEKGT